METITTSSNTSTTNTSNTSNTFNTNAGKFWCTCEDHQLIIKFKSDELDQSNLLLKCLNKNPSNNVKQLELSGDHLTPASAGFRQQFLAGITDGSRQRQLNRLAAAITEWWNTQASLRN